jgi:hypothetical protein
MTAPMQNRTEVFEKRQRSDCAEYAINRSSSSIRSRFHANSIKNESENKLLSFFNEEYTFSNFFIVHLSFTVE